MDGDLPAAGSREPFHLWSEHVPALQIWVRDAQSCWRVGMAGATGMSKSDLKVVIEANGHSGERANALLLDLLVMEREALAEWARQRKAKGQR